MLTRENKLLKATIAYYEAQRLEAIASLEVFFENPVGVAEHSNFLEEIKRWTTTLAEAEESISTLKRNFLPSK
jgi:hypothetical protein